MRERESRLVVPYQLPHFSSVREDGLRVRRLGFGLAALAADRRIGVGCRVVGLGLLVEPPGEGFAEAFGPVGFED